MYSHSGHNHSTCCCGLKFKCLYFYVAEDANKQTPIESTSTEPEVANWQHNKFACIYYPRHELICMTCFPVSVTLNVMEECRQWQPKLLKWADFCTHITCKASYFCSLTWQLHGSSMHTKADNNYWHWQYLWPAQHKSGLRRKHWIYVTWVQSSIVNTRTSIACTTSNMHNCYNRMRRTSAE